MHISPKYRCVLSGNMAAGGNAGFSLTEVIVSLVVAAILGTLLIQFMGINLSGSAESVVNARQGFQLRQVMEQITRDYRNWLENSPEQKISDFKTQVDTNYAGYAVTSLTEIDPGNDGDIEILQVTLSDGSQSLVSYFTK